MVGHLFSVVVEPSFVRSGSAFTARVVAVGRGAGAIFHSPRTVEGFPDDRVVRLLRDSSLENIPIS